MELPRRPAVLDAVASQIVPSILLLFLGLKPLYAPRHGNKADSLTQAREQDEDQNGEKCLNIHGWMDLCVYPAETRTLYIAHIILNIIEI